MKKSPLQYALDLVALRDRTEAEIRKKMTEKDIAASEIEEVISFLKEKSFLDDSRFVQNFINSQKRQGRFGKYRILNKLKTYGVAHDLVSEAENRLDADEESARAFEVGEKWLAKNTKNEKTYEKLCRHLSGRGFDYDIIKKTVDKILRH
jgi:regulatory protein